MDALPFFKVPGPNCGAAWSGYAAWWYAVCVELFFSKGEKAIEVESTFSSFLSIVSLNLFARW